MAYRLKTEIEDEYTLDEYGIVKDMGKFQGEPWTTVVIYDWMMDGGGEIWSANEDSEEYDTLFELDSEDRALLELENVTGTITRALLSISDAGFVSVTFLTDAEWEEVQGE